MANEFSHRKTHRGDWEIISSNLRWQLRVFNLAKPDWHGTDARKGNRLFCIRAGSGFLRQVENGKKLDLAPGYAYFIPKDVSVEQNFLADLELYAMEFHRMNGSILLQDCSLPCAESSGAAWIWEVSSDVVGQHLTLSVCEALRNRHIY